MLAGGPDVSLDVPRNVEGMGHRPFQADTVVRAKVTASVAAETEKCGYTTSKSDPMKITKQKRDKAQTRTHTFPSAQAPSSPTSNLVTSSFSSSHFLKSTCFSLTNPCSSVNFCSICSISLSTRLTSDRCASGVG